MDIEALNSPQAGGMVDSMTGGQDLGKEDFLKLLVTQLRHQDPMDPMDDKEFIAQTAQFSALEQMQNLNSTMESFMGFQKLGQASGLIGRNVQVLDSENGQSITGEVEKVIKSDSNYNVVVEGKEYELDMVQEVSQGSKETIDN